MEREKVRLGGISDEKTRKIIKINEIESHLLCNPANYSNEATYVGRGSFGRVRVQMYRGMKVAVKEFLPHSIATDVRHEARVLSVLCHPYLPLLFGMNTSVRPYRIVMQYHAFRDRDTPMTLVEALRSPNELHYENTMIILCVQLMEAMRYLHNEVNILHNDLKCNNILLCDSHSNMGGESSSMCAPVKVVVIDFGKATSTKNGKTFTLSEREKAEHIQRFSHISREVIEGITSQTTMSDMFSAGCIIKQVADSGIATGNVKKAAFELAGKCCSQKYLSRPTAQEALDSLKVIYNLLD